MTTAWICFIVFLISFFFFLYYLNLALLFARLEQRLRSSLDQEKLLQEWEEKQKKCKNKRKKNVYLFFSIRLYFILGEEKRAQSLLAFLHNDKILGIEKRSIQI